MQLGISTYSFPWSVGVAGYKVHEPLTAKELLDFAAYRGIKYVQFGDNYPLHTLPEEELTGLKKMADELAIQIQVGTRGLTVSNIHNYLGIAVTLNASFLRVVIDSDNYHPGEEMAIEIIRSLLPRLQESKVQLAIENHDRFSVQTLKRIIEITDPECVGICLDTANSLGAGEGIKEVVAHLAPYTINLHIKDYTIKRVEHKMGFKVNGCIAGEGMLDIPWLVAEIRKNGRCETATLEVWCDPEQTIEATILKEKEWVEKSIDYLKTIII